MLPDHSDLSQNASEVVRRLDAAVQTPKRRWSAQEWFSELKRRRVFRALVGYGIAAFAMLQIIEPIMHGVHWPE